MSSSSYTEMWEPLTTHTFLPLISRVSVSLFASISAANILTGRNVTLSAMNLSKLNIYCYFFLSLLSRFRLHIKSVAVLNDNPFCYFYICFSSSFICCCSFLSCLLSNQPAAWSIFLPLFQTASIISFLKLLLSYSIIHKIPKSPLVKRESPSILNICNVTVSR